MAQFIRFETNVTHTRSLTLSPFSSEDMADIGEVGLKSIQSRLGRAEDLNDAPAPPLVNRYAMRKANRGLQAVRDWRFRGATRNSIKVKSANENQCTIGPTTSEADMIIGVQNARCPQWPVSPKDVEVINLAVRDVFETRVLDMFSLRTEWPGLFSWQSADIEYVPLTRIMANPEQFGYTGTPRLASRGRAA
jgi:hypothetical protein